MWKERLSPRFFGKEDNFETDLTGVKHLDVYSDRDKLQPDCSVFGGNAVEYTGKGGRVRVAVVEGSSWQMIMRYIGLWCRITVLESTKEFQEHVFEPFERENNTTFSGIYGTGLGLAITRNIVKIMGDDRS